MKRPRLGRPSPALVISLVALFVALGGTGYAALKLPKNSVGTKQLRKNAVTGAKVKNGSITATDIKKGSLTGATINLGSLGAVPSAAHASTADNSTNAANASNAAHATDADTVGGHSVITFSKLVAKGTTTPQTVFSLGGLTVTLACNAVGSASVQGIPAVDGAMIRASKVVPSSADEVGDSHTTKNVPVDLLTTTDSIGALAAQYAQPDGHVVSVNSFVDNNPTINGFQGCSMSGSAISG